MSYATLSQVEAVSQIDASDLALSTTIEQGESESEWQSLLRYLMDASKARIDSYCRRDFEHHESETVKLSGKRGNTRVLRLPHPVIDVQSVTVDGQTVDTDSYVAQENGSLIKEGGGSAHVIGSGTPPVSRRTASKPTWPAGYDNIVVTLDYGFTEPPTDVVEAEVKLTENALLALSKKREAPVIQTDEFAIEIDYPDTMTREIKRMLEPHRVVGVSN